MQSNSDRRSVWPDHSERNPLIEKRTTINSDMRWEIPAPSYSSVITSQPPKLVPREDPTIVRNTVPVPPSVLARYSGTPYTTAASDNDDCCESCFRCCVIYSRMSSPPIFIYTQ